MSTNSVTVNITLYDGAPGPRVKDLGAVTGGRLVTVEFTEHPAIVSLMLTSPEQADRVIAAFTVARELLTGGAS